MNNLNEYKDFIKYKNINEAEGFKTTHGPGSYAGTSSTGVDSSTYFANVHGNLAGAENTLVGSAVIKLFGFIKRKGMEVYIRTVLKPKLGKILMNGILRYAIKHDFIGPKKKELFVISKVEENENISFDNKVSFKSGEETGLSCIVVGALVSLEKPTPLLVDGEYVCMDNGIHFNVVANKITLVGQIKEDNKEEEAQDTTSEVQSTKLEDISDEDLEKERSDKEKALIEGSIDLPIGDDIKNTVSTINKTIQDIASETAQSGLSPENEKTLTDLYNTISKSIEELTKFGLGEIEEALLKHQKNLTSKKAQELLLAKQEYIVDIRELIILRDKIKIFIRNNKKQTTVAAHESIRIDYNQFLLEKTAVVNVLDKTVVKNTPTVSRLGDELKQLSDKGEAVDLNDENFYKQFESDRVRKEVSLEVLTDKASIIKLQLTAENIIGGGVTVYGPGGTTSDKNRWKLENYWKRSVEDVLSRYSKFMVSDAVNPYIIIKNSASEVEKWRNENNTIGNPGNDVKSVSAMSNADNNKLFKDSTTLAEMNKIGKGDHCILKLGFKSGNAISNDVMVLKRITDYNQSLKIFKLLGTLEFDKITPDYKDINFEKLLRYTFPKFILPTQNVINGQGIKGIYILADTKDNFSVGTAVNKVSIMYLYANSDSINWDDKDSYTFKIKYFKGNGEERPLDVKTPLPREERPFYKIDMFIDKPLKYKISSTAINSFGTFKEYDIMKAKDLFELYKTNIG